MGNVAVGAAQSMSLESFVNGLTPEKHLIQDIHYVNKIVQNTAGGRTLDDSPSALRMSVIDIRNDTCLRQWVKDYYFLSIYYILQKEKTVKYTTAKKKEKKYEGNVPQTACRRWLEGLSK